MIEGRLLFSGDRFPQYEKSVHCQKVSHRPFSQLTPPQRRELLLEAAKEGNIEIVKTLTQEGYVDPRYKKNKALRIAIELGHQEIIHYLMAITNTEKKWPAYDRLAARFGHCDIETRFCQNFHPKEIYWAEEIFDNPRKRWA